MKDRIRDRVGCSKVEVIHILVDVLTTDPHGLDSINTLIMYDKILNFIFEL